MKRIINRYKYILLRKINEDFFLCNNVYDKNKLQTSNSIALLLYFLSILTMFVYFIFGFYWQGILTIYLIICIHLFWVIKSENLLLARIFGSQNTIIYFFLSSLFHGYPTTLNHFYILYIATVPLIFASNDLKYIIFFIMQSVFLYILQGTFKEDLFNLNMISEHQLETFNYIIVILLVVYLMSITSLYVILNNYQETKQKKIKKKLYKVKNRLYEQNKELQTFGLAVTHSIKTPLFIIKNFLNRIINIINDNYNEVSLKYYLKLIRESNILNEKYSNDLISYASLSKITNEHSYISLKDFLTKSISIFTLKYPNARIINDVGDVTVETNGAALEIIIENLIDNALKYNKGYIPTVKIYGYKKMYNKVSIFVEDNGIGIKEDFRKKIFDPFTRINEIESSLGSGLGLFIAKNAAAKIDSTIKLNKSDQYGSIFEIQLNHGN